MTQELGFGTEGSEAETAANGKDQLMRCVPGGQREPYVRRQTIDVEHTTPTHTSNSRTCSALHWSAKTIFVLVQQRCQLGDRAISHRNDSVCNSLHEF